MKKNNLSIFKIPCLLIKSTIYQNFINNKEFIAIEIIDKIQKKINNTSYLKYFLLQSNY